MIPIAACFGALLLVGSPFFVLGGFLSFANLNDLRKEIHKCDEC
jgi:hypothetical protein